MGGQFGFHFRAPLIKCRSAFYVVQLIVLSGKGIDKFFSLVNKRNAKPAASSPNPYTYHLKISTANYSVGKVNNYHLV